MTRKVFVPAEPGGASEPKPAVIVRRAMQEPLRIALFAPPPGPLSDEETYRRRVIEGLRSLGHDVERVAVAPAGRPAEDRVAVIDGAVLPDLPEVPGRAVALVHRWSDDLAGCAARLPSRVIASSAAIAERLTTRLHVGTERIAIVPPGIDDAPRSPGSGGPGCAILSVAPLIPCKGHETLFRALARLADLDWSLTLCGSAERDPVHARTLAALAQQHGIAARVRIAAEASWRGADLFALASEWEDDGAATGAALKRGLPVAVTSGGANAEMVPVDAGVVCPPGDVEGFSKALRRVIFDEGLRRAMAEAARLCALPDWPTQIAALAKAIEGQGSALDPLGPMVPDPMT